MSSGPWTVVGAGMYGAGVAPKVGYTNGSDGAMPLFHVGILLGACSDCRLSLLNSPCTRQSMPLTEQMERREALWGWQIKKRRATRG